MAVPTISSITPSVLPAQGDAIVTIAGTNFNVPALPDPSDLTVADTPATVRVMFGAIAATAVSVLSATALAVLVPAQDVGTVDVVVTNLDQTTGAPIAGETVTLAGGFKYALPITTSDAPSDLEGVSRTLLQLLKKRFTGIDVTFAVHTDYDPTANDGFHVTKFAALPGLSLVGPDLRENRFYSTNEQPTFDDQSSPQDDDGTYESFVETRVPFTVDVLFDVICASNAKTELLNLMSNFVAFMHKNKWLYFGTTQSGEPCRYELDFEDQGLPKTQRGMLKDSNVFAWTARVVIRGFNIEEATGVAAGTTANIPNQAIVNKGKTLDNLVLDPSIQIDVP